MDSYATLDYANEYHGKRQSALMWSMLSDEQKNQRLVSATDFIDINFEFKNDLNLKAKESGEVPNQLVNATCEVAAMNELVIGKTRDKDRVKVDVIEINYTPDSGSAYSDGIDRITKMLKGLLVQSNGISFKVYR